MKAGHQPVADRLCGPFEMRSNGAEGYEIVGDDGAVAIWGSWGTHAATVKNLLNLAHKCGKLN